jgi:hypothetical protein
MFALPAKGRLAFHSEITWIQIELNCCNDKLMTFEKYSDQNAFLHSEWKKVSAHEYQKTDKPLSTSNIYPLLEIRKSTGSNATIRHAYCRVVAKMRNDISI